jgi:hypothetical protein
MSDIQIIDTATRYLTRHKTRQVSVIEAEAKSVDVCLTIFIFLFLRLIVTSTLKACEQDRHLLRSVYTLDPPYAANINK